MVLASILVFLGGCASLQSTAREEVPFGEALERKTYREISIRKIIKETQATAEIDVDKHLAFVWWIPYEYWATSFENEKNIVDEAKAEMLRVIKQYNVIAMVQADVTNFGVFNYYTKNEIEDNLRMSYQTENLVELDQAVNVSADMKMLLSKTEPVLRAAMGNLGRNFHFYLYPGFNSDGERVIDPYKFGTLKIRTKVRSGKNVDLEIELPLNSLYEARICPNGKEAHVSWAYCPWSGQKI